MTVVGFGQAGSRMVDQFAKEKDESGDYIYNPLALNSNDGDLEDLKYIPSQNRISLKLGGLGKNPKKAFKILESNEDVRNRIRSLVRDRIRPDDDLVMFFAGLGGGTGTSTIVKSVEEYVEHYNKPKILEELNKIKNTELYQKNPKRAQAVAVKRAEEKFTKIGIVVSLPVRSDGPDVLRQVNDFANRLLTLSRNVINGIAFITFVDNQHFYEKWKNNNSIQERFGNYRDYANHEVFTLFHELNLATNSGNTDVVLDSEDFKRILLEGTGTLVFGKEQQSIKQLVNSRELTEMVYRSFETSVLHDPIQLQITSDDGSTKPAAVHHVGVLSIIDKAIAQKLGSSFLDMTKDTITDKLRLTGTLFTGYIKGLQQYTATVYSFYKTSGLPKRLSKGLVKEYEEFKEKRSRIDYKQETIERIEDEDEFDINFDLSSLGIKDIDESGPQESNLKDYHDIDDDIDLDFSDVPDDLSDDQIEKYIKKKQKQ